MNRREFIQTVATTAALIPSAAIATHQLNSLKPRLIESRYKDQASFVLENDVVRAEFVAHGASQA